jgi:hypothetical protein
MLETASGRATTAREIKAANISTNFDLVRLIIKITPAR